MPIGGKLVLKGGVTLKPGVEKKKAKKKKPKAEDAVDGQGGEGEGAADPGKKVDSSAINVMTGKNYEQEFDLEMKRAAEGKARSTPWGSSFRAAPEILHGYTTKVTGKTASERLDMRSASRADKFCK